MKSLLQRWLNPSTAAPSIMCAYSHSFLFHHSHGGTRCGSALLFSSITTISGIPPLLRNSQAPLSHTTLRKTVWPRVNNRPDGELPTGR